MQDRERNTRNWAFLAVVLVIFTVYYFFVTQGTPAMRFSAADRTFSFSGPKGAQVQFSFETLDVLEFYELSPEEYGTSVEGGEVLGGYRYGLWRSTLLGDYEAFLSPKIGACILAGDGSNRAVFNTSNIETTRSLYEQMTAFWHGELQEGTR